MRMPMPMLSGSAANPRISTSQIEELVLTAEMRLRLPSIASTLRPERSGSVTAGRVTVAGT